MSEWNLPISSQRHSIQLKPSDFQSFWKAFGQPNRSDFHPLVVARTFKGMFELFHELQLNMKGLLHTGQKIETLRPLLIPNQFFSITQLVRVRSRGAMHFLEFENKLFEESNAKFENKLSEESNAKFENKLSEESNASLEKNDSEEPNASLEKNDSEESPLKEPVIRATSQVFIGGDLRAS
jgi:hypothetical protein